MVKVKVGSADECPALKGLSSSNCSTADRCTIESQAEACRGREQTAAEVLIGCLSPSLTATRTRTQTLIKWGDMVDYGT